MCICLFVYICIVTCYDVAAQPEVKKPFSWAAMASKNSGSTMGSSVPPVPMMSSKPQPMKAEVKIDNGPGLAGPQPQRAARWVITLVMFILLTLTFFPLHCESEQPVLSLQ